MTDWKHEFDAAVQTFKQVAILGGEPFDEQHPIVELLDAPHASPTNLPAGKIAIYAFWGDGEWLKIGKVGTKSAPRYTSQHYNPKSTKSNLAKSIGQCGRISIRPDFQPDRPGDWIRQFCHRANILLPNSCSRELQTCFEAFLHLRLRPRFEH